MSALIAPQIAFYRGKIAFVHGFGDLEDHRAASLARRASRGSRVSAVPIDDRDRRERG